MSLTPEQKAAVSSWIAAGDNLSAVQKKLIEQFKVSMTYRDVRFLVDDLNLELKDPAPKVDASDVSKTPSPAAPSAGSPAAKKAAPAPESGADDALPLDEAEALEGELEEAPAGTSHVVVTIDKVTLIPGAIAGGTVTFSDGVTGKWIIDQQYRPGFTEISQPGYRPTPADGQAFMEQLSLEMQKRGF